MEALDPNSTVSAQNHPSLFELLAQDQLRSLLQPAVLAHSYPRYLIPVVNRHEEFYALLMLLVERHHLLKHSASFSEHFYGLRRNRASLLPTSRWDTFDADHGGSKGRRRLQLSNQQILTSLLELVVLPYVGLKLHDRFLSMGGGADSSVLSPDSSDFSSSSDPSSSPPSRLQHLKSRARSLFLILYPWINLGTEVGRLVWSLSYLFGKSSYWRVESWMVGYIIGRITRDDIESPIPKRPTIFTPFISRSSILNRIPSPPSALPFLLLSLKFLEFYHSPTSPFQLLSSTSSSLDPSSKKHTPILPPPPRPMPSVEGARLLEGKKRGACPLCGLAWRAPTVAGRLGCWVYCWGCIWDEVGEKGKADPVSGEGWVTRETLRRVLI
ncbi:Predicted E3 ubiquitin ligase involved in peroxisome organization [Phaffia rhodozyma]|uniref:Peroxisome assembly protein 12 n=1 Tax=Phaffia rhodozyma TaxID=264483 RepID=A0A0F7SN02_PHARH|nr:Predicted E3 ubiquitin ligase involved in peroxisome organization [Phaffia rhodozyma]